MNRLCLFLTSADKGIANNPLFPTSQHLVFSLVFSGQSDQLLQAGVERSVIALWLEARAAEGPLPIDLLRRAV